MPRTLHCAPVDRTDARLEELERRFQSAVQDLKQLRSERIAELRANWADTEHKISAAMAAAVSFLFVCSFFVWSLVGQRIDARVLPAGSDLLLDQLPLIDLVPVLTVGWLSIHVLAIYVGVMYCPRRWAFILATIGLLILVRTAFVALNPIGAPPGILSLNASYVLAPLKGILAFENEFFFSGHVAFPYLYSRIYWHIAWARRTFVLLSIVMAASVVLTRNHYTMDVLGAYFVTYSVYALSCWLLGWLDPERERWQPERRG